MQLAATADVVGRLVLEAPWVGERQPDRQRWEEIEEMFASWMGLNRDDAERIIPPSLGTGASAEDVAANVEAAIKGSPSAVRSVFAETGLFGRHELLAAIRCPTLLLYAASDVAGVMDAEALALAQANPLIRVQIMDGADTRFMSLGSMSSWLRSSPSWPARSTSGGDGLVRRRRRPDHEQARGGCHNAPP